MERRLAADPALRALAERLAACRAPCSRRSRIAAGAAGPARAHRPADRLRRRRPARSWRETWRRSPRSSWSGSSAARCSAAARSISACAGARARRRCGSGRASARPRRAAALRYRFLEPPRRQALVQRPHDDRAATRRISPTQGFPLAGGRIDIVDGKAGADARLPPRPARDQRDRRTGDAERGRRRDAGRIQAAHWSQGDLTYWAVSDLTGGASQLVQLFQPSRHHDRSRTGCRPAWRAVQLTADRCRPFGDGRRRGLSRGPRARVEEERRMCGRFTQHYTWAQIKEFLDVFGAPLNLRRATTWRRPKPSTSSGSARTAAANSCACDGARAVFLEEDPQGPAGDLQRTRRDPGREADVS